VAEFANGLCSTHYSAHIRRLADATKEERKAIEEEHTRRWVAMRLEEKSGDRSRQLRRGGVPALCIAALKELRQSEPVAAALELASGRTKLLLILGRPGTGKSLALAAACAEVAHKWPWNEQPGGGQQIEPFMFSPATALDGLDTPPELERCKLLCLDEMGRESQQAIQRVCALIIARHGAGRLTALASNLPSTEWKARYGPALEDRLRADGRVVQLAGPSQRKERAK
jgi:DNA replication protein DnaC